MSKTVENVPQDRDEELREQILVNKRRSGGDPSLLLDLLSELIERESWKKRTDEQGNHWSFLRYVQTPFDDGGLGWDRQEVENIIKFDHKYEKEGPQHDPTKAEEMEELRRTVKDLLNPGEDQRGKNQYTEKEEVRNTKIQNSSDTESYVVRRLKRDHPELAEKVLADEMSANQAAIEAGFRDKKASIPVHKGGEPQIRRAAKSLAKHFDGHLDALIRELKGYR